jgi:hypothetical protein
MEGRFREVVLGSGGAAAVTEMRARIRQRLAADDSMGKLRFPFFLDPPPPEIPPSW